MATAFAQLGMPQDDAWAFARDFHFESALIVVNSKEHTSVMPSSPSILTSVGERSRMTTEEQSHPVVYEREPVHGVLRQVHNLNLIPENRLITSGDE